MDNPACSTVDVPSLLKTDRSSTSLFDNSELKLQCYHNEGVIVDDEENTVDKDDTNDGVSSFSNGYSEGLLNIMPSPSWKNKDIADNRISNENEDDNEEEGSDTKQDDNCRVSDGESCNSNFSFCSTYSEPYIKVTLHIPEPPVSYYPVTSFLIRLIS